MPRRLPLAGRRTRLAALLIAVATLSPAAQAIVLPPPDPWVPGVRKAWIDAPPSTKTATLVNIVFYEDNTDDRGTHDYTFGDGTGLSFRRETNCVPLSTRRQQAISKAYRRPGTYTVRLRYASDCDTPGFEKTVSYETRITVQPGPTPGNGPKLPTAGLRHKNVENNMTAHMIATFNDEDGYIHKVVFDWGDKKSSTATRPMSKCKETRVTWPRTESDDLPDAMTAPAHRYAYRGQYTVIARAYSVGCNGRDTQVAEAKWLFTV